MTTVEFTHTITRNPQQAPFFPGDNASAESSAAYNYAMSLVNNGFNGLVNIIHTENSTEWKNTFTCDFNAWEQFKNFVENDSQFIESMRLGHNYGVQNDFEQNVSVVFKDEDGNVIEESEAY